MRLQRSVRSCTDLRRTTSWKEPRLPGAFLFLRLRVDCFLTRLRFGACETTSKAVKVDTVPSALIREHLNATQSRIGAMSSGLSGVKTAVRSMKTHFAAVLQADVAQDKTIASMQALRDRIEQRLNLQDGT